MSDSLDRKLLNLLVMKDLLLLERKAAPDPERERRAQERRIKALMERAYSIPFYRARFDSVGLTPADFRCADDLRRFPLLTKAELREWMAEELGKQQNRDCYVEATSGSSGTPTRVLYSPREKAWNMANWLRVLIKAGYDPFFGNTVSRKSPSGTAEKESLIQKLGILRREFVNQYAPEAEVIAELNRKKPDLLYMNKAELMRVALYSVSHDIPVHQPKFFCPTGEMIDDVSSGLLRRVFGSNLVDSYGTVELGAVMLKLPGQSVFRVHSDLFAVNVYGDDGQPAPTGKLAVTPLYKTDFPLINYVVGDTVSLEKRDGVSIVTEIQGRTSDFIRHENGDISTFFSLTPVFSHCREILQLRVIQTSYRDLTIQAVLDPASGASREEAAVRLNGLLQERLRHPMNITFEWMDVIPPDPNGKLRLLVSRMDG